jgi:hypothetical protein
MDPKVPTQAFSDFVINRELGDWAEAIVLEGVNSSDCGLVAVPYGRQENLIAGEPGFTEFYRSYYEELRTWGKRPDLLIFSASKRPSVDFCVSSLDETFAHASQALAAFELVRRSKGVPSNSSK